MKTLTVTTGILRVMNPYKITSKKYWKFELTYNKQNG